MFERSYQIGFCSNTPKNIVNYTRSFSKFFGPHVNISKDRANLALQPYKKCVSYTVIKL